MTLLQEFLYLLTLELLCILCLFFCTEAYICQGILALRMYVIVASSYPWDWGITSIVLELFSICGTQMWGSTERDNNCRGNKLSSDSPPHSSGSILTPRIDREVQFERFKWLLSRLDYRWAVHCKQGHQVSIRQLNPRRQFIIGKDEFSLSLLHPSLLAEGFH